MQDPFDVCSTHFVRIGPGVLFQELIHANRFDHTEIALVLITDGVCPSTDRGAVSLLVLLNHTILWFLSPDRNRP